MANPDSDFRKAEVAKMKIENIDFSSLQEKCDLSKVSLPFNCPSCSCGFETEPALSKHMSSRHPELNPNNPKACPICDKILSSEQRLKTHIKIHLTCKICKKEFKSEFEMLTHKKEHTTCNVCGKDFLTESKLKRHGQCKM